MPQKKRLPRAEFQARGYKTTQTHFFSLKTKHNESKGVRIGIVVGKNVHKSSVKRNFWKRQARSVLEALVRGDRDVIILLRSQVKDLTRKKFRDALAKSLTQ